MSENNFWISVRLTSLRQIFISICWCTKSHLTIHWFLSKQFWTTALSSADLLFHTGYIRVVITSCCDLADIFSHVWSKSRVQKIMKQKVKFSLCYSTSNSLLTKETCHYNPAILANKRITRLSYFISIGADEMWQNRN